MRYGLFDDASSSCTTRFVLSEHAARGTWLLSTIRMGDRAGNLSAVRFLAGDHEEPQAILVQTASPDSRAPEVDLDDIGISARAVRPEAPDGETIVSLVYLARDDGAGLGPVSFNLRDPQGIDHLHYHYHENFHGAVYEGDPSVWTRYEVDVLLPAGSAPGIWGLSSMQVRDKVRNIRNYAFAETLRFELLD